ncbi:hypothetical protein OAO87_03810 [bacterium]|nr:hypothetical protein [bacterium]
MLPMQSEQHTSSHRADAILAHVSCCQCCLNSARQAIVLTPSLMMRWLSQLRASSHRADATSKHL